MGIIKKIQLKLNNIFNNDQNKRKTIENAIVIFVLGIVVIIAGSTIFGNKNHKINSSNSYNSHGDVSIEVANKNVNMEEKGDLEKRMESILSQINGVGRVSVMITYVTGKEYIHATDVKRIENFIKEKDNSGGDRDTKQDNFESKIVFEDGQSGSKKPVITKEIQPIVKGVIVVADGAADVVVRESIARAIEALLDVPIHKVQIFQKK